MFIIILYERDKHRIRENRCKGEKLSLSLIKNIIFNFGG